MKKSIEERRSRLKQMFIFLDKKTVNQSGFENVKIGSMFELDGENYEVISIFINEYLNIEFIFITKI